MIRLNLARMRPLLTVVTMLLPAAVYAQSGAGQGYGPNPRLPAPQQKLLPTVHIAPARGWPDGKTPQAAAGLKVTAFATGLDHPRWLQILPNGDVLVAETNAPERPKDGEGVKGLAMKAVMKRAGAATPSANRITLLRDADGDGIAEQRTVFVDKLNSPFGMAVVGDAFYVANTDALLRYPYQQGQLKITAPARKISALPGGPINHHWTKSLLASADGKKLYVGVGSNSNVAENGLEAEAERAAILEIDAQTGERRVYASGLRNPVGMAWGPDAKTLWTVVNERDELGDDLVPDYLTSVRRNGFYGWPWSYFGRNADARVKPAAPERVAAALAPDYALGAHTASLGLAWGENATALPSHLRNGMFVGQHGSWNRKPRSGYKVIFVPFADDKPQLPPIEVLDGFVDADGNALGRPVGVAVAADGGLLVADDVGNAVWRVAAASPP